MIRPLDSSWELLGDPEKLSGKKRDIDKEDHGLVAEGKIPKIWGVQEHKSVDKRARRVTWRDPEHSVVVAIPNRDDLDVSEIWHDIRSLGYDALIARNNKGELREYSESMLSLDCLSSEAKARYAFEVLEKESDELSKPVEVDQSKQSGDENDSDVGLDLDDEF